jgi:hypothetical protein
MNATVNSEHADENDNYLNQYKMKNSVKIAAILFLLLLAGNGSLSAQRGMRDDGNSARMGRPGSRMYFNQMRGMRNSPDSMRMSDMRMGHYPMHDMKRGMSHRPMYGMRGDFRHQPMYGMRGDGIRGNMGPGRFIDNIPNLTEKQTKDIAELRQSQMEVMKKVREDTFEKMKSMRDANRSKILNILTDEQKKYIESEATIDKTDTQKSN